MDYRPRDIEKKWKTYWEDQDVYKVSNQSDKPKYYVLDMFPYPSGSGLHVGHPLGYIASDIFARYKRLRGFNVLHPMGYDAFGLPAEQYAIQMGVHPAKSTAENIARYRSQLDNLGFSFDWSREVNTSKPSYYKWTQWIFLQLFQHWYDQEQAKARSIEALIAHFDAHGTEGLKAACSEELSFDSAAWSAMDAKAKDDVLMNYRLAYKKQTFVNWCEALGTVLANDEVKDGLSERGGHPVERRPMLQWSLRITAYAERLLSDLDTLEWSDAMKKMQANWIGKSIGAQMFFDLEGSDEKLEIFTTRPDTIFGATFMVVAPEHDLVAELTTAEQKGDIDKYLDYVNTRSERERMSDVKTVTGAFTGAYAINPFNKERVPIWISEYVLKDYGTGAIMAVPADDERDRRFAEKFGLPIIDIIDKSAHPGATIEDKVGTMINSDFLNGMEVLDAIQATLDAIEQRKIGKKQINYKLRDAIYSRQRYWGEPFPVIYDAAGVSYPLKEEDLPLELPELDDFKPASGGKSPLARKTEWVNRPDGFFHETDTMPGFAGSSWYYLRYMDATNAETFAGQEAINYWRDVDLYVGGTEHAVGHLMYARVWHKFLYDLGHLPTIEPFQKLINQGMIQGVIEYLYLSKEKKDGQSQFVCAKLAEERGIEDFARMPVYVAYVADYGTDNSHLNAEGIRQFTEWRPEFEGAAFECVEGTYQNGVFQPKGEQTEGRLHTKSEVGKMSKRYFNVINPDDVVERYGSDCFRLYEMFLGPIEQAKPWDTKGIDGVSRFLRKFWALFFDGQGDFHCSDEEPTKAEFKILHKTIKKVTEDIERFSFNTCVSAFMVATNELSKLKSSKKQIMNPMLRLIAPFAPHMSEELWHQLGHETSIHLTEYPALNEEYLKEDAFTYPIAINGKTRLTMEFPADAAKETIEKEAVALEGIQKWLEGKTVRKVIVVPKRMINIVVG
ncbi:MAG: class I tRNA ligase family protein [Bacteroidota bacterium]